MPETLPPPPPPPEDPPDPTLALAAAATELWDGKWQVTMTYLVPPMHGGKVIDAAMAVALVRAGYVPDAYAEVRYIDPSPKKVVTQ